MTPTIDILMAVYNNEAFIIEQLESLLGQTYSHFRVLIRDDCSSDNSVYLIEKFSSRYPNKFILIKGTKNLGAMGNFACLVNESSANYVMFSDADDVWFPTKIEETLAVMQKNENLLGPNTPLLIHSNLEVVDRHLKKISNSFWDFSQLNPKSALSLNRLLTQNVITGCTMLVNRPLLQLALPIPEEAIMHDWWLGLVAAAFGSIDFIEKPTMFYRQHGNNSIGAKNKKSFSAKWMETKKSLHRGGRFELKKRLYKTVLQAKQFETRYRNFLEKRQMHIVRDYASLEKNGYLKKRYLFFKHRFFKHTLTQNIGMLFLL